MNKKYVIFSVAQNAYWKTEAEEMIAGPSDATRYDSYADAENALLNVVYGTWNIGGPLEIKEYFFNS